MHELIGLKVRVVGGRSKTHIGIEGVVVDEGLNVLYVRSGGRIYTLPKESLIFEFFIPTKEGGYWKRLSGKRILNRPENRIKRGISKY